MTKDYVNYIEWANNDLDFSSQTRGLNNALDSHAFDKTLDKVTDNQIEMLSGDFLHDKGYKGQGVLVGVLDSGFHKADKIAPLQHLYDGNQDNGEVLYGFSMLPQNEDVYGAIGAQHGLNVLSCMAALSDDYSGTAPHAHYILANTEDPNNENPVEESWWVQAAEKMDSIGVDVINTSLGYTTFDNNKYNYDYTDMDGQTAFISRGAKIALEKGIFLVTSAGNSGSSSWKYISAPADVEGALTVGAVNAIGEIASFSSYGPSASNVVKPEILAKGSRAVAYNQSGNLQNVYGTSFSSPIAAGMVACMIQAFPSVKRAELKEAIVASASTYPNYGAQTGYGIPDFSMAFETLNSQNSKKNDASIQFRLEYLSDRLMIVSNDCECIGAFRIYNMLGQLMINDSFSSSQSTVSIQSSILTQGIYILVLETEDSEIRLRFIKMNKICALFDIKYPIVQGGMVWVSGHKLVTAVSNAGGLGILGSGSMYPEVLREHIRRCKANTNKPFGVNVPLMYPDIEQLMAVIMEEKYQSSLLPRVIQNYGQVNLKRKAFKLHTL